MKDSSPKKSSNLYIQRIMELCEQRGWTINRLATEAGIAQSTLSGLSSKGNAPTIPTLERLTDAFGITMAEFFAFDENTTVLTEEQRKLLDAWSAASPEKRKVVFDILTTI